MHNWYANLLLDHRWLAKRKEALHYDHYTCQNCGRKNPEVTLCVHHLGYVTGWMPWDYPLTLLQTLCLGCHKKVHAGQKPHYVICITCGGLTPDSRANGRNDKHEWICEDCIQKQAVEEIAMKTAFVYLMKNTRNGFIKIGFSKNPKFREKTLQSEEPEIELLASIEGTIDLEKELHARFSAYRIRGEWFRLSEFEIEDAKQYVIFHHGSRKPSGGKL
jgi:predicted RNA-binding Zn-ribbon protein involved in translation (DUF1610 family)